MSPDEFIYMCVLLFSLPVGHLVKHAKSPTSKKIVSSSVGIALVASLCHYHILHSIVTTIGTCVIVKVAGWRHCHKLTFAWCFGYIAFFRMVHFIGLPYPPSFANAVQLLLTLKMVGMTFEIHDSYAAKINPPIQDSDKKPRIVVIIDEPSVMDICHYAYCYIGIMTGPYYKYKTYYDMIHNEKSSKIDTMGPLFDRLKFAALYGSMFIVSSHYITIDIAVTDEFFSYSYWFKTFFMVPMFFVFRTRMYAAWVLSECICVMATLGAYPKDTLPKCAQGPTVELPKNREKDTSSDDYYSFETINNINGYKCDFTSSFRDAMRYWNMTVQWWLANYIYRRVPSKAWRTSLTMLVSAFWHGIHPGYYLSFMTVPIILMAEDVMIKAFRRPSNEKIFDWLNWFFRMRSFEYLSMGFLLLKMDYTLNYWKSTYFIGHAYSAIFILFGTLFKPRKKKLDSQTDEAKKEK
ncbi:membrane-bound acylglycerophosphatidylinositol O-acyltransferase mboat7-like [Saccoglossus kowalevskii]|uniref:Lysophospholipid acyltransferase 7 n=1 Tax=Saccoglossus kowalevskii TaxID=10224 RepID=A0ABM0GL47_SACKO|nr:PREDICTED: lysophospholipid acyltransferase 7-like [Saccoglossus kowalevskii]